MTITNRGIVKVAQGRAILTDVPMPKLADDRMLLKAIAVALNPTDYQTTDEAFRPGTTRALLGCDVAGIIVEVGPKVTKNFKKGDRVVGVAHGGIKSLSLVFEITSLTLTRE
jgi:NADPH:quinone reductase-like Zn-dependent oxidoreductase